MSPPVELTHALAVSPACLHVSARPETMPPDATFTRLFRYDEARPVPWSKHDVPWLTVGYARFMPSPVHDGGFAGSADSAGSAPKPPGGAPVICALSEEGDLELEGEGGRTVERIPEAGLFGPASRRVGYVSAIRQIGEHLHVSGDGGQVYRRLGQGRWTAIDVGLLQPPGAPDLLLLSAIAGTAEDDIYVAGDRLTSSGREGCLFHWNGSAWSPVSLPSCGRILALYLEGERLWLCGTQGTVLAGDRRMGFTALSRHRSSQVFRDLTRYQGALYLASNHGLFRYDEERRRVVRARTDLDVEISYAHTVDHAGGTLWCVGPRDIARCDGTTWTRVHHPDNPRIEG
jgi:hypothetical protein